MSSSAAIFGGKGFFLKRLRKAFPRGSYEPKAISHRYSLDINQAEWMVEKQ
jgi:hypothetical protein